MSFVWPLCYQVTRDTWDAEMFQVAVFSSFHIFFSACETGHGPEGTEMQSIRRISLKI